MSKKRRLARIEQVCWACPSAWDAWDEEGNYLYLRYRHGTGTVKDREWNTLIEFSDKASGSIGDGLISIDDFCEKADLQVMASVLFRPMEDPTLYWSPEDDEYLVPEKDCI